MSVNLLNEKDLNDYFKKMIWGRCFIFERSLDQNVDKDKLSDVVLLEKNKDNVVKSIVYQYINHRLRSHLMRDEKNPCWKPVESDVDLPVWAKSALARGQKLVRFNSCNSFAFDMLYFYEFLYALAEKYVFDCMYEAKRTKRNPRVRLDYLKTHNGYADFNNVIAGAVVWKNKQKDGAEVPWRNQNKFRVAAESGTKFIMDLPDEHGDMTLAAYQLLTVDSLIFEGRFMSSCLKKGNFDAYLKCGSRDIYSIRDKYGMPHATLEVQEQSLNQCKGKGNGVVARKYIPAIQYFVKSKKLSIGREIKNTGLIQQGGAYYSLYDLPNRFVFKGCLDLSEMDLTGINLGFGVTGELNLSKAKKFPAELNFSQTRSVDLSECDLGGVLDIKWPKESVKMDGAINVASHIQKSYEEYQMLQSQRQKINGRTA